MYIYIYFLSEEVFLTAVCAFERQTKFVKSWFFLFAFSASTFFSCLFWPCGQKRLNYLTRMRRGSNNRETPKGVPSSKNNRQSPAGPSVTHACEPNQILTATVATAWVEFTDRVEKPFSMHTGPGVVHVPCTRIPGESYRGRLGSLFFCVCVMFSEHWLTPLFVDST